jgi:branched-subunit amino acid ABC-type transport system permease component
MWLMLPLTILSVTLCCLTGLVIYAVYSDCDPLAACHIKRKDQIVPYFVVDILGGAYGIPGLFLSSLVCGTLR